MHAHFRPQEIAQVEAHRRAILTRNRRIQAIMNRFSLCALGLCMLGVLALAASCAAPPSPPPAAPLASAAPAASPAAADPAAPPPPAAASGWAAMDFGERKRHMKNVVLPRMKEVFVAFDAARYGRMTCVTCHGEGAADGGFRMPNPSLPKLPASPEGFKRLSNEKPQMTQFMLTKVKPMMAKLLGLPELTPESRGGFGCMACHTK
jgi:hypothetical protein